MITNEMLSCVYFDIMKKEIIEYVKEVIGIDLKINQLDVSIKGKFPMYLKNAYQWYQVRFDDKLCLFAVTDDYNGIGQLGKHLLKAREIIKIPVVAVFDSLEAFNRKRLIEKKIAFLVPGKQLYIPEFVLDLREYSMIAKKKKEKLIPVAQQIFLMFLLDKSNKLKIEQLQFKRLAELFSINPMGISRAVENLKNQGLIEIVGTKEKTIRFNEVKAKLWLIAKEQNILISPVIKRVFVDELPHNENLMKTYDSALEEYTNLNPSHQNYYAIEKGIYQKMKEQDLLVNENNYEGEFCIEVWKYNPLIVKLLFEEAQLVDPLSLSLCYKDAYDERVEMAIEQIENKYLW